MPTRLGSAIPAATSALTPHVMSSCIFRPTTRALPAFRNFLSVTGGCAEVGCSTA